VAGFESGVDFDGSGQAACDFDFCKGSVLHWRCKRIQFTTDASWTIHNPEQDRFGEMNVLLTLAWTPIIRVWEGEVRKNQGDVIMQRLFGMPPAHRQEQHFSRLKQDLMNPCLRLVASTLKSKKKRGGQSGRTSCVRLRLLRDENSSHHGTCRDVQEGQVIVDFHPRVA
jgi:hypothetical protein